MKHFGKLTSQSIYDKSFNIEFKGYSMLEVDTFLDEVIADYQHFETQLLKATEMIQDMQRANAALQAKLIEAEGRLEIRHNPESNPQQSDLLKRLSKLEQEVYQK